MSLSITHCLVMSTDIIEDAKHMHTFPGLGGLILNTSKGPGIHISSNSRILFQNLDHFQKFYIDYSTF
jgi:hypothetical protein